LLFVVTLSSSSLAMGVSKEMKDMIDYYNLYATCFGEEAMAEYMIGIKEATKVCMNIPSPLELLDELAQLENDVEVGSLDQLLKNNPIFNQILGRERRQIDAGLMDEDDINDLKTNIADHKTKMMTKIGNLTCVLAQMEVLNLDGTINIEAFSAENMKELLEGYGGAGDDEDFVQALATSYQDCYDISNNWPQSNLDRHPMMQAFGRQHIYLMCTHKMEEKLCYKYQMYQGLKAFHGLDTGDVDVGIPGNKFDAATGALMVMHETSTDEEKFIENFFWTRPEM